MRFVSFAVGRDDELSCLVGILVLSLVMEDEAKILFYAKTSGNMLVQVFGGIELSFSSGTPKRSAMIFNMRKVWWKHQGRREEGLRSDFGGLGHQEQAVGGVPRGIRTPVTAVKGRCPRPG
jgi:hypothetical protein